jgi:hypothetical protein
MRRAAAIVAISFAISFARVSAARAQSGEIWMGYDSTSGFSTVELRPMAIGGVGAPLSMHVVAVFKGRAFATPQYLSLSFIGAPGRVHFAKPAIVTISLDGANAFKAGADEVLLQGDRLALRVPTSLVGKLGRGTSVRGNAAGVSFTMSAENIATLRDYAERLTATGYDRAIAAAKASAEHGAYVVQKDWYEPSEVDERAAPTLMPERPRYPAEIAPAERVRREFYVELLVDTAGHATLRNAQAIAAGPVAPFVDAIRAAMAKWEYTPAKKDGHPVAQIIRQVIVFDPASLIRER